MTTGKNAIKGPVRDDESARLADLHASLVSRHQEHPGPRDDQMSGILNVLQMMERSRQRTSRQEELPAATTGHIEFPDSWVHSEKAPCIDRFEVVRTLGVGGSGIVLLARDPQLGRKVAIKVPTPDALLSEEFIARFQREARVAARLRHPHIVSVFETDAIGPICYIVSDYCDGPNLLEWLRDHESPIAPRPAAALIRALADAVRHAHSFGIIHRDIKPANILFKLEATSQAANPPEHTLSEHELAAAARLADFGLARQLDDSVCVTSPAAVVGTPAYMSPEQAGSRSAELGTHSDIFSLGVILYEILTGVSPFVRESPLASLDAVRHHVPTSPGELAPETPADLAAICSRCIEKRPDDRYETAAALVDDLDRFLSGVPVVARQISPFGRAWRWALRNQMVAMLLCAVLLLISTLSVGSIYAAVVLNESQSRTFDALKEETQARQTAVEKERAALLAVYDARVAHAQAMRRSSQSGQRLESLASLRQAALLARELKLPAESRVRLRSEAIAAMSLFDLEREHSWPAPKDAFANARANASGSIYARIAGNRRKVEICDAKDNSVRQTLLLPPGQAVFGAFLFGPNSRYLAHRTQIGRQPSHIHVWDLETRQPLEGFDNQLVPNGLSRRLHLPFDFSQDGRIFAVCTKDRVCLIELATGREMRRFDLKERVLGVRFSPVGSLVAIGSESSVCIYDHSKLNNTALFRFPVQAPARRIVWNSDATELAALVDRSVVIWSLATGSIQTKLDQHGDTVAGFDFHSSGRFAASHAADGYVRLWSLPSGRQILRTRGGMTHFVDDHRLGRRRGIDLVHVPERKRVEFEPSPQIDPGRPGFPARVSRVSLHPNGQLAVKGTGSRVDFLDVLHEQPILSVNVPIGQCCFDTSGSNLCCFTEDRALLCFPVTTIESDEGIELRIASIPKVIASQGDTSRLSDDPSDRRFCHLDGWGHEIRILDLRNTSYYKKELPELRCRSDVTANGQFIASGGVNDVIIRSLHDGEVHQVIPAGRARPCFQPNAEKPLLAVSEYSRLRFFRWSDESGLWELAHTIGSHSGPSYPRFVTFSACGRFVAAQKWNATVNLIDTTTMTTLASFELTEGDVTRDLAFSPDTSRLIVGTLAGHFQIWRLDSIETQLNELGVGWGSVVATPRTTPKQIRVHWKPELPVQR